MNVVAAYVTLDPKIVEEYSVNYPKREEEWRSRVGELMQDQFGQDLLIEVSQSGRILGFVPNNNQSLDALRSQKPYSCLDSVWRLEIGRIPRYVPNRKLKYGKAMAAMLEEEYQRPVLRLPGMPYRVATPSDTPNFRIHYPAFFRFSTSPGLYAGFACRPEDSRLLAPGELQVPDPSIWESVPLSRFYLLYESSNFVYGSSRLSDACHQHQVQAACNDGEAPLDAKEASDATKRNFWLKMNLGDGSAEPQPGPGL